MWVEIAIMVICLYVCLPQIWEGFQDLFRGEDDLNQYH